MILFTIVLIPLCFNIISWYISLFSIIKLHLNWRCSWKTRKNGVLSGIGQGLHTIFIPALQKQLFFTIKPQFLFIPCISFSFYMKILHILFISGHWSDSSLISWQDRDQDFLDLQGKFDVWYLCTNTWLVTFINFFPGVNLLLSPLGQNTLSWGGGFYQLGDQAAVQIDV